MSIFSEKFQATVNKAALDAFGKWSNLVIYTSIVAILSGLAGFAGAVVRIDPRVSAVESKQESLDGDFDEAYGIVNQRLKILEDAKLETSVQVQMLILYQIPASEREGLRKQAEKQVEEKLPELANPENP